MAVSHNLHQKWLKLQSWKQYNWSPPIDHAATANKCVSVAVRYLVRVIAQIILQPSHSTVVIATSIMTLCMLLLCLKTKKHGNANFD